MKSVKAKRKPGGYAAALDKQHIKASRKFAQVVGAFADDREVMYGGGKGFGSAALKAYGKLFAMISSKGKFVVKLPRERVDELVRLRMGEYFDPGHGRLMKEWIALDGAFSSWTKLAKEARRFVAGGRR